MSKVRSSARQLAYGLRLYAERVREPKRRPTLVIFPSNQPWDPASRLRAWELAPQMRLLGWRVIVVPEALSLSQRRRVLSAEKPDVIVLQQTRHPLNRPHLYSPYPCVLDADDADYLDPAIQAEIVKGAEESAAVIGGSRFVAECLGRHNRNAHVVWTSTPAPPAPLGERPSARTPIVAWAHSDPLSYPAEAAFIQRVMLEVAKRTTCQFLLFGTSDERAREWIAPLTASGVQCSTRETMPYDEYLAVVSTAAVGLQPVCVENQFSRGKSFGKLLAYFVGQVPAIATDAVDHPLFFASGVNGFLLQNDELLWADAITRLLQEPELRDRIADTAWHDFKQKLSSEVFAASMDRILRSVINERAA